MCLWNILQLHNKRIPRNLLGVAEIPLIGAAGSFIFFKDQINFTEEILDSGMVVGIFKTTLVAQIR